jgi:citrate synthase
MEDFVVRIKDFVMELMEHDQIDVDLYDKFNVKRGLRNADGTGVLVGLTHVGDVHGYIIDENEKVAVPGKLFYRGYDV